MKRRRTLTSLTIPAAIIPGRNQIRNSRTRLGSFAALFAGRGVPSSSGYDEPRVLEISTPMRPIRFQHRARSSSAIRRGIACCWSASWSTVTGFVSLARGGRRSRSAGIMKKTRSVKKRRRTTGELRSEYRFDYNQARPNRFAARYRAGSRVVVLDPDIARVFTTPESVNGVLRALLKTMPRKASGA